MSIKIELRNPVMSRVLSAAEDQEGPLTSLKNDGSHLHGELCIVVNGHVLPRVGFFGPQDVCVGEWVHQLTSASRALCSTDPARYLFDECEQGQPAYLFAREMDHVIISVVDSELGDGPGTPEWGRQSCTLLEFETEVNRFISELADTLESAVPGHGRAWVRAATSRAGA